MIPFFEYRRMKRRVRELNKAFYGLGDPLAHMDEVTRIRKELEPLEEKVDLLETRKLELKSNRLCIEMPKDREGWWRQVNAYRPTGGTFESSKTLTGHYSKLSADSSPAARAFAVPANAAVTRMVR